MILFACILLYSLNVISANFIVETKSGKVAGKEVHSILRDEKYYSFLGIPYGQPPIGELRFKVSIILLSLFPYNPINFCPNSNI